MTIQMSEFLGDREQQILVAVVCEYISTADPVGSRTIARKYGFGISPATIRNIMADLEEMGFLAQPHTSAGRIPTDKGLRFYVNHLDSARRSVEEGNFVNIEEALQAEPEFGTFMQKVTALLSALSHQAGMVLTPNLKNLVCRHIDFVKLSNFQVLVIFISDTGIVQKRVIRFDEDIAQDTLDKVSRLVTEELMGLSVASIRTKLVRMLETEKTQFDQLFARAVKLSQEFFAKELDDSEPSELYVGGTLNMLNQPEFADLEKMKLLFRTFEEKRLLIRILDKCIEEEDQERVKVIIGDENIAADVKDLSFVISSYKYGDRALGVVGIVGPKRMDYTQIIPIVDHTAKALSRLLIDRMEM